MVRICGIGGDIFKSRFNIGLLALLLILGALSYALAGESGPAAPAEGSGPSASSSIEIHFFYLPTCPTCGEQKPIFEALKREGVPGARFYSVDVSKPEGFALFREMAKDGGIAVESLTVPTIFVGGRPLVGLHTEEELLAAIREEKRAAEGEDGVEGVEGWEEEEEGDGIKGAGIAPEPELDIAHFQLPLLGEIDLLKYSLPTLAVVLGLVDGFNPCAMWVLVYLIGLLAGVRDRRRAWLIVGSFVLASGALYFLIMAAWINVFLLLGYVQILTILIGLVALGGGILSIRDHLTTGGSPACRVGGGEGRRETMGRIEKIVSQPLSVSIFFSIVALAFLVNAVEFLCSSAIPAVFTHILALSGTSTIENYLLIALYTFFFMLDDMVIFSLAAFAAGSSFGERYARWCKVVGGTILAILGLLLLFAPHLLW